MICGIVTDMRLVCDTWRDWPLTRSSIARSYGSRISSGVTIHGPIGQNVSIPLAASAAFGGFLLLNTLYLQGSRGPSPLQAGLATVPLTAMTVIASPLSGRLV